MITIQVIISRPNKLEPLEWPENSHPLSYPTMAGMGTAYLTFPHSRFVPDATLEMISFMKLQGFTIMEAPGKTVVFRNNIYIMSDTIPTIRDSVIMTNCI